MANPRKTSKWLEEVELVSVGDGLDLSVNRRRLPMWQALQEFLSLRAPQQITAAIILKKPDGTCVRWNERACLMLASLAPRKGVKQANA